MLRSSAGSNAELAEPSLTTVRAPGAGDAVAVWDLVKACPPLDPNSFYCNLLQCTDFADTCALAERDRDVVGWVSGYRPPDEPDTLFIWQVAVHPDARGQGLGKTLIADLLARDAARGVLRLRATITDANAASWSLFQAVADDIGATLERTPRFLRDEHFGGRHDTEHLVTIAPLAR